MIQLGPLHSTAKGIADRRDPEGVVESSKSTEWEWSFDAPPPPVAGERRGQGENAPAFLLSFIALAGIILGVGLYIMLRHS